MEPGFRNFVQRRPIGCHRSDDTRTQIVETLVIDGPPTTCLASVKATLNEIECSIAIQNEGFENLVRGSQISIDEVISNAPSNWYLEAQEARKLGLIEAVL
ncbi:hypothetical protein [Tardiphaga sp.]|jgi:hypothetical protein|uniref:hypothetical protein n=1 Tax=Tardiphaga sp. TaxID=1926292 RepID=UPI0037DA37E0